MMSILMAIATIIKRKIKIKCCRKIMRINLLLAIM